MLNGPHPLGGGPFSKNAIRRTETASVTPLWLTLAVPGRRQRHVLLRRAVAGHWTDRLVPAAECIARAPAPLSPAC
jgi:hypothetical protein